MMKITRRNNLPTLQHYYSDAAKPGVCVTSAASYDNESKKRDMEQE